jgi:3',5'-cyclic AMP phosphodiesterase CpdA
LQAANLELVTLTETSAVFTWYSGIGGTTDDVGQMLPFPSDGQIAVGDRPDRLTRRVAAVESSTPYHYVEVDGLEPGRTYWYQAVCGDVPATATVVRGAVAAGEPGGALTGPFSFTTPPPPAGRRLFTVALCNDLHLGETVAGLTGLVPGVKGIEQVPGHRPYPTIMAEAMAHEARERGADYLLAAGDVTSECALHDAELAKTILNGFGAEGHDYWVARGNHDRGHTGPEYAACRPGKWQGRDCFADVFMPEGPGYFSHDLHGLHIVGIDTYDKPGDGGDAGGMSGEQMAWLRADLAAHADQPTLVFGHHPLSSDGDPLDLSGNHALDRDQARQILGSYRTAPGVFLHHAGHTHRNYRTMLPNGIVQQEVSATKEYPGGFTLLRIHSGGYALNFYKTRSPEARAWSERSRAELAGLWPDMSLGSRIVDRNSVVAFRGPRFSAL